MKFETYAICDKGLVRSTNEDNYLISADSDLIIVSDGMGGYEKGEVASKIIIDVFHEEIEQYKTFASITTNNKQLLQDCLENANLSSAKRILEYAKQNSIKKTIGATIVGFYYDLYINKAVLFHLGDSRIYRIRENQIDILTIDHNLVNETLDRFSDINKSILSKAIGNFIPFELEVNFLDIETSDIYLICTDGVYNYIKEAELLFIIQNNNLRECCKLIENIIYSNGAKDNLTLVLAKGNF